MSSAQQRAREAGRQGESSALAALHRHMESAPFPFAITRGATHTITYANAAFRDLSETTERASPGGSLADAFSAETRGALNSALDAAFGSHVDHAGAVVDVALEGGTRWRCAVWAIADAGGRCEGLGIELRKKEGDGEALGLQREVAEQMLIGAMRERGLAEDAEAARRHAAFLAEAGRMLAESVDQTSTLVALTKLALPTLGSWCIVDLLSAGDHVQRLGIFHPDPSKQKLALELEARWTPEAGDTFGAAAMLRSTRTIAITGDVEATLRAAVHSVETLEILHKLGIGSLLTVPLVARGKLLGAVTFVSAERGRPYTAAEVQLAEDLALRGALALDNAQIYDSALVHKKSAETANRAKTAFLGAMSHELRTPLNAIGGYIELLDMGLRGPVTEDQHADLARIRTNQQHLLVLITEILNYARAGGGHFAYNTSDINAYDLLVRAVDLIEPLIAQRGLSCRRVAEDPGLMAHADPEKVTQILLNLLSNALKFTPSGGTVTVSCTATADLVQLNISDTGVGIAAHKFETIFEPFVQLKDTLADRMGGIGLGLAISRDLARAMEGDLEVVSTEGKGSCFTLSLPRAVAG